MSFARILYQRTRHQANNSCVYHGQQNLLSPAHRSYTIYPMNSHVTPSGNSSYPSLRLLPEAALGLLADALGDPTRRAIFQYVAESKAPLTAGDVGEYFGVHRTVARAHLERLVETDLLESGTQHTSEGGRPPKVYSRSERRLDLQLPARQYELLADLLLESLESFGEAAEMMAEKVGFAFGEKLGAAYHEEAADPLQPLIDAGAEVVTEANTERVDVTVQNCLFREIATRRPRLVCTLDRAIIRGMLSVTGKMYSLGPALKRTDEEDACRLTFVEDRRTH